MAGTIITVSSPEGSRDIREGAGAGSLIRDHCGLENRPRPAGGARGWHRGNQAVPMITAAVVIAVTLWASFWASVFWVACGRHLWK